MKQVVLIGDSIRMGYQAGVAAGLAGIADVWGPEENGGTSRNVLAHLDEWLRARKPDIVHVNCGLHDLAKKFGVADAAVPLAEYTSNVAAVLDRLLDAVGPSIVWATTTPVNEERHHANKEFDRFDADVVRYNAAATREAADERGLLVNDLYAATMARGRDALLHQDGVHFTDDGYAFLGATVAASLRPLLA